jgi:hypothetical protein
MSLEQGTLCPLHPELGKVVAVDALVRSYPFAMSLLSHAPLCIYQDQLVLHLCTSPAALTVPGPHRMSRLPCHV